MGVVERREREKLEVREKILDAARELFAKEGYERVTMRRIAEAIEYSPTTIYLHFEDKDALIRELCLADFLSLAEAVREILDEQDPLERLVRLGRAYAEWGLSHPHHYRLMFMEPHPIPTPPEAEAQKGNPETDAAAVLAIAVRDAFEKGHLRPELTDPDLIAQTVWAALHGVISIEIALGRDPWVPWRPLDARVALMQDAITRGIVRPEVLAAREAKRRAAP